MGGPNQEKGSKFGSCIEISNPKTYKGAHSDRKKEPKRGPFLGDAGVPVPAAHPVYQEKNITSKNEIHGANTDTPLGDLPSSLPGSFFVEVSPDQENSTVMCNPKTKFTPPKTRAPHSVTSPPRFLASSRPLFPLILWPSPSSLSHCLPDWVSLGPKTTGRKWIEKNSIFGTCPFSDSLWADLGQSQKQFRGRSIRSCQERCEALNVDDSKQLLCATCGALRFLFGSTKNAPQYNHSQSQPRTPEVGHDIRMRWSHTVSPATGALLQQGKQRKLGPPRTPTCCSCLCNTASLQQSL